MYFRKGIISKKIKTEKIIVSFEDWNFDNFGKNFHKFFQAKK